MNMNQTQQSVLKNYIMCPLCKMLILKYHIKPHYYECKEKIKDTQQREDFARMNSPQYRVEEIQKKNEEAKKILKEIRIVEMPSTTIKEENKRVVEKLTDHPSIDTSPSYSPDGSYITFNSDRSGLQQIYTMKSDGTNVKRISFGEGLYGTPVWSPRGDLIAFTKLYRNKFYIGVMRSDGSGERLLTENYYQEAPSWAPNGRVLVFYRETASDNSGRGGGAKLWSIDLTGYNERLIQTPTDASDPSWSGLLSGK